MVVEPQVIPSPASPAPLHYLRRVDQAVNENNVARAAIWWVSASLQTPIWEAMEMSGFQARVAGIPGHLGPLTVQPDSVMFVGLQTLWARQPADLRDLNKVPYSLRLLHHECLGRHDEPNAEDREVIRRSLERLASARIERSWWDASRGTEEVQWRHLIADADFIRKGRPGQYGRQQAGWVSFSPEILRQLQARQIAYALDLPTLWALSSLVGKRLYLFLAGDSMKPLGDRHVTYTYPLGARLYGTLGITDTNAVRVRQKIVTAGEELMSLEPLYERIAVEQKHRRGEWHLRVIRRKGASLAAARRRESARREAAPSTASDSPIWSEPDQTAQALSVDPAVVAREMAARADPRARAAAERSWRESDFDRQMAWRAHHRDLVAWIIEGEPGSPPAEPVD